MKNSIQFLEALGRNPVLNPGAQRYSDAIESLEIIEAEQIALRDRDHVSLNELLNGRMRMLCAISTPDDGSEYESTPDEDKDEDGIPDEVDPTPPRE